MSNVKVFRYKSEGAAPKSNGVIIIKGVDRDDRELQKVLKSEVDAQWKEWAGGWLVFVKHFNKLENILNISLPNSVLKLPSLENKTKEVDTKFTKRNMILVSGGATKENKEELKKLGATWVQAFGGWLFPSKEKEKFEGLYHKVYQGESVSSSHSESPISREDSRKNARPRARK